MEPPKSENVSLNNSNLKNEKELDMNDKPEEKNDLSANYSNNDEDILNKLNEEGDKLDSHVDISNLKISSKYEDLSETELKKLSNSKNETLIKLNDEKESSKRELNVLIKKLNELISQNADILYCRDPDPLVIKQLERVCEVRKRDLDKAQKSNKIFKEQYEEMVRKNSEKFSSEKLNEMDMKIDNIRKQNASVIKKIREIRNETYVQSKELEICAANKKYPKKIMASTEEVKSLSMKKHECHLKLNLNKRSLGNVLEEFKKFTSLYNDEINEHSNEEILNKINKWKALLEADLSGGVEDILLRVDNNQSKVLAYIDGQEREMFKRNECIYNQIYNKELPKIELNKNHMARARSSSREKVQKSNYVNYSNARKNSKNVSTSQANNSISIRKGIFQKFSLLSKGGDKNTPRYMRKVSPIKEEENKNINPDSMIEKDYENATDYDYKELLQKKEQYREICERTKKSIKEQERQTERKIKDITLTINQNNQQLKSLMDQNELIESEINNLKKIYQLTLEQNKLRREIKQNESKYMKTIQQNQHTNNDPSVTQNDILMELNKLGDEDKKKYANPTVSNTIEEEQNKMEHVDSNKGIKFADISNVEKIDEDGMGEREKRLNEIKSKYMSGLDEEDDDNFYDSGENQS